MRTKIHGGALALLLAAVPASAHGQVMQGDRILPPKEYDKPYTDGFLVIRQGETMQEMTRFCPMQPPFGYPRLACSYQYAKSAGCVVFVATDDMIKSYGIDPTAVMRHELGHCNGWPSTHFGAR
jgi:hypothetical protein